MISVIEWFFRRVTTWLCNPIANDNDCLPDSALSRDHVSAILVAEGGRLTPGIVSTVYEHSQRTAELRVAVHERSLTDPIAVVSEALDLLADGERIYLEMQEVWPYTTRNTDQHSKVYSGVYIVCMRMENPYGCSVDCIESALSDYLVL